MILKTAECVTPKHPDKMADNVSDSILDYFLQKDENSRVAIETLGGHKKIYICGEVTSKKDYKKSEIEKIVKDIYENVENIEINIVKQSPEIAKGVDVGGAGDQGIMVGYACLDNKEYIPQELYLARSLCKFIYKKYQFDGKTQITINKNKEIQSIVCSFQNVKTKDLENEVKNWYKKEYNKDYINKLYINPCGDWEIGGFDADTGLTGRKIAVDNYGPQVEIGGGAFSGKDYTKVDRSGAYKARQIALYFLKNAKNFVKIKIAYSIGIEYPVMISLNIDGKDIDLEKKDNVLYKKILEDCSVKNIIKDLKLKNPIYKNTSQWGHFGNKEFTWENINAF